MYHLQNNKIRLLEILVDEKCPIANIKLNDLTKKFPKLMPIF